MEPSAFPQRRECKDERRDAAFYASLTEARKDEEDVDDDDDDEEEEVGHGSLQQERGRGRSPAAACRYYRPVLLGLLVLAFLLGCVSIGSRLRVTAAATGMGRFAVGHEEEDVPDSVSALVEPSWAQLYELKLGRQVYHIAQGAREAAANSHVESREPVRTIGGNAITLCVVQSNLIAIQLSRFAIGITNAVAECADDGLGGHRENATCAMQFMAMFITLTRMSALMSTIPLSCDAYSYQTNAGCSAAVSLMIAEVVTLGAASTIVDSFCSSTPSWKMEPNAWPKPAPNARPFGTLKLPPWLNKTKENLALCILSVDQASLVLIRDILTMINAHTRCTATQFPGCDLGDTPRVCHEKAHNFTMRAHSCTRKWQCSPSDRASICLKKIKLCHLNNERQPSQCAIPVMQSFGGLLLTSYWLASAVAHCGPYPEGNCIGAGQSFISGLLSFASAGMQQHLYCGQGGKDRDWMLEFRAFLATTTTQAPTTLSASPAASG